MLNVITENPHIGTATGNVRIYNWPPPVLTKSSEQGNKESYTEYLAHSTSVVSVQESPMGDLLISVGK